MLGDTAIAVNPKDSRYQHLIGKFALHPFNDRRIPIISDDYVDPEFGTGIYWLFTKGAVKITPAHDFNDFQMYKRHKLDIINIFTDSGKINDQGGKFEV